MSDVLFVVLSIVVFVAGVALVRLCDRIVLSGQKPVAARDQAAAGDHDPR